MAESPVSVSDTLCHLNGFSNANLWPHQVLSVYGGYVNWMALPLDANTSDARSKSHC